MKTSTTITLTPWQAARLVTLVEDGQAILRAQDRTQRGLDGYTTDDLRQLKEALKAGTGHSVDFVSELKITAGTPVNDMRCEK